MVEPRQVVAAFPPKLIHPLLEATNRYVTLHGGRGGGKSWAAARALLIRAANKPLRILCVREFMASITDSVHKLLCDQIHDLQLDDRFIIEKATISGINGSEFRFAGIRNNVTAIKSFEGIDICWAEEAANISSASWETLIPTIRKPDSQILITFNAHAVEDNTWQRFVVDPPPNSLVVKLNYDENPFFPEVLREEMEYMKQNDPDAYQNVWLGYPKVVLENAVYARELRACQEAGRMTSVPYDSFTPVNTFWDLGWRDRCSIVLAQLCAGEFHIIDYIEASQKTVSDYIAMLQRKPYVYGTHFLPHDGAAKSMQTGRSVEQIMRMHGLTVKIVPRLTVNDGLNAVRQIFPSLWIDEKKCSVLIHHLRHYCYDLESKVRPVPVHDEHSHCADAVRGLALSLRAPPPAFKPRDPVFIPAEAGWMS